MEQGTTDNSLPGIPGDFLERARTLQEQVTAWRRDFHRHPELGYEEFRTSDIVAAYLDRLGLEVVRGLGGTGVVGILRGGGPGPTFALRADMDALPIADRKNVPYKSLNEGVAHLCGHDGHTSMLMGAAHLLTELRESLRGNIKFIFQPAEEGLFGARKMIEDGVLKNPQVSAIAGLHVNPNLPTGKLSVARGIACAACDTLKIKIIGKGGHAAHPHLGIDSIAVAAQVVSALQLIASRQIDPLQPVVVTIGRIEGGVGGTAIAPEVSMLGTVRTLSPALRGQMPDLIERVIRGITESFGASYELEYINGNPSIVNDDGMVDLLARASRQVLGGQVLDFVPPSMGGEDFSFYSFEVPAVFYRLGVNEGTAETSYPLHHPMFDLDEGALTIGIAAHAAIAWHYLEENT